jgi:hypothetical protein
MAKSLLMESKLVQNVTFGADPELFLKRRNNYISAVGRVGGTKEEPKKIEIAGAAIQEDNVAVEFNIPPAKTKAEFSKSIFEVLAYLTNLMEQQELSLALDASATFEASELESDQAKTFGCEPDYNAWLRIQNPPPELTAENWNLRSAGGHLHIGYANPDPEISMDLIRLCDIFIGCPSVLLDHDTRRRQLYGKAGAFRFKDYGVEYRTLSNFWLRSRENTEFVIEQAQKAIDYYNNDGALPEERDWPLVHAIINKGELDHLSVLKSYYPI